MRPTRFAAATTIILLAGCGGNGGGGGVNEPQTPVFTTLQVEPASRTVFAGPPGNSYTLTITARDQNNQLMSISATPVFTSSNEAVATVSGGVVTVHAAGNADITVSLTIGGVTKTAAVLAQGQLAPESAAVVAPLLAYEPQQVDIRAGGTVSWTFGEVPHTVTFIRDDAPASVAQLQNGTAARAFPTTGVYNYTCTIHPSMNGSVHVH